MPAAPFPAARLLHAGALTCWLVGADLRRVSVNGQEVIQRIYFALRDAAWRTIPLHIHHSDVTQTADGFTVIADLASHGPVAYRARITLSGTADGHLQVVCDGIAEIAFARMRLGWCIHHPQQMIGTPLAVGHDANPDEHLHFPEPVEPWLVATNIRWLETGADAARVRVRFSGEQFEMEDQRNYGDASFKTYGTLSALPRPVMVQTGEELHQSLIIEPCAPSAGAQPQVQLSTPSRVIRLRVDNAVYACARIGHLETAAAISPAGPESHRLIQLDLTTSWHERLAAVENARAQDGAPTLFTVLAEQLTPAHVAALTQHLPPDSDILVLDDPDGQALARLRAAAPPETFVGHGSRYHFNDVNRGPRLASDFIGFSINPLVHADDTWSLLENTPAMAHLVTSAKALNPRLRIGPVVLPADDVRMQEDLGATWLIAMLAHLLPGLDAHDAVTLAPQSQLTAKSVSMVVRAVHEMRGRRPILGESGRVAALALDTASGCRVLLANTDHQPISVVIGGLRQGAEAIHLAGWAWAIVDG